MANAVCFSAMFSHYTPTKPGIAFVSGSPKPISLEIFTSPNAKFHSLQPKATPDSSNQSAKSSSNQRTKPNSLICADCDGNGAVLCSQCKGSGVNSVDHFNGQFKAGGLCWLCRGKREMLCGNCNGAGFVGGFMSSFEE